MRKFFNRRGNKGFTVIELVVSVIVVGILIAIAAPIYAGVREDAKQTAHDANVRKFYDAAEIWVMKNPGVAAIWNAEPGMKAREPQAAHEGWMTVLKEWPVSPFGAVYVVEITEDGQVTVSPDAGVYE